MTRQETIMHNKMKRLLESSTDGSVAFKNYKVLCTEFNLPYKTSDSKKAQLRKLSYFCNLEKGKGNSLFYTEVYPDPDQRMLQEKLLTKNIEMILLKTFLNSDGNTILLNNHDLWELLGFINSRYSSTREEKAFIESTGMNVIQLKDFKKRCSQRFNRIIISALDKLTDRRLITYSTSYIITEKIYEDNKFIFTQRPATTEETTRILEYEADILEELSCDDIHDVWNRGLEKKYYSRLDFYITENENWHRVSKGFYIILNQKQWLRKGLRRDINILGSQSENNAEVRNLLEKNAEKRYDNYIENLNAEISRCIFLRKSPDEMKHFMLTYQKHGNLMEDDYVDNQKLLIDHFIDINNYHSPMI